MNGNILQQLFFSESIPNLPSTLYLVVGMIPLIPGAALYYMMRNAIQTNFKMFAERGLEAVITGGAIASGIITAMVCWNVIKLNLLKK